ncbi:nuclear pore complex protein Nup214 [Anopheles funestus]|uniref:nuclear pore complex protein Nup214 n=1 Tax=Anopheles funestus TaxID=62324 RepID=UPI0020C5ED78|nr:nuclear pore complex protein Nup214 [Anopheles funestus]XP_049290339.1 nuclear pore complex protein Nup214 [Anopheles funestus]XP_049290340.1 nuclear pore complex protein Nup214 [Anopheles funestus]XP_049290341.1 nuclear pore complex protein Nup214 [Anopheles funestus]
MSTNSPGTPKKCRLILQQCLAIQLTKPGNPPEDFWMYDSGYTIFQNFLSANLQCWWNAPLAAATKVLKYLGHISPGMLLITAEPCALEIIRSAYARSVLKPPATYLINSVGDIDDCIVTPIVQTQFTPLTEALCDVIMELTSQGQSATIENIRNRLRSRFTHMQQPSVEVIYDTLVQLMQEIKIYQTSKGYFIVTPEKRRNKTNASLEYGGFAGVELDSTAPTKESKTLLMSSHEALSSLYGEISTVRDGDQTHQCIQTNLADVICGGNPNDKILYPRSASKQRSASFPSNGKTLERRHSLRFFGSSKRLQRSASTRSLSKNYAQTITKDGTMAPLATPEQPAALDAKKQASSQSLLSRIFRRSTRSKSKSKQIETYSAQFPPPEWFNSKTTHLHSVGTQTTDYLDFPIKSRLLNSTFYDSSDVSQRSLSLPRRRHHRRNLSSESTFFISSRDCSPVRRGKSPGSYYCGSLPRSIHSTPASSGYYKVSRSKQLSSADKLHSSDSQAKMEHKTSRSLGIASGPSSIDSGKMTYVTSGPSSFDSEKLSSTRTSTHSSLESHVSSSTITTAIQQQQQQSGNSSLFISNDTKPPTSGSPQSGSPSRGAPNGTSKPMSPSAPGTVTTVMTALASTTKANNSYKCFETTFGYTSTNTGGGVKGNAQPTKLADRMAKSPALGTGLGGLSLTKPIDHLTALSESLLQFRLSGDSTSNSGSAGSSPPGSTTHTIPVVQQNGTPELNKYNKNSTMNNSKPFQPMTSAPVQPPANFFYKNVLKNIQHDSKNICGDLAVEKTSPTRTYDEGTGRMGLQSNLRRSNSEIKKLNANPSREGKLAEADDPKGCGQTIPPPQPLSGLIVMKKSLSVSSEPNLLANGDSKAAQITILVQENGTNGTERDNSGDTDGRKRYSHYDELDRRFSYQNSARDEPPLVLEEMYEFPSLSDLSFNFTSLAAQKILQGDASLNSIDTLVELNINQEKQQTLMRLKNDARLLAQTVTPPAEPDATKVMTDFGMV